jgi:hypothetical protein
MRIARSSSVGLALALLPSLTACSSESGSGQGGGGASGVTSSSSASSGGGAGGSGGADDPGPSCAGPGYRGEVAPQRVETVEATVVDPQGSPIANQQVQLCGLDICLFGTTDANGHVVVDAGGRMMQKPAFKFGDGVLHARLASPLPADQPSIVFPAPLVAARFPELSAGQTLAAGQTLTSSELSLTLPSGAVIDIDTLLNDAPEEQTFRAVEIPLDAAAPALDPATPLDRVFAVTPLETKICPDAAVSVPNRDGWPAGTAVEFFVHGLEINEEYAPYAGWAKVSDGAVSADGMRIETAQDGGLPILGVIGIHRL